jgi:UPF0755 protein
MALLRKITQGEMVLGKLTIVEGWSFADMRRAVDAHPDLRHDSAGMSAGELLRAVDASEGHPEGLFFPDTYFFDAGQFRPGHLQARLRRHEEAGGGQWPA